MTYRVKKTHVHPFHASVLIGLTVFFVVWLISAANPVPVTADSEADLESFFNEKDRAVQAELLRPDVVLEVKATDPEKIEIPVIATNGEKLDITILPKGQHQRVDSSITIIASAPMNLDSLKKSFTMVPAVEGSFTINGRVASFVPLNKLMPQTIYTVTIDGSLYGQNGEILNTPVVQTFETEPDIKLLSIPYYRQQYSRSCEAASLRMALSYKGTVTDDMEIVKLAGYNPREPDWTNRIWDNPYEMFVGFISGSKVGYGMYASALAKAAESFGYNTRVLTNPNMPEISQAINAGNPVIVWGYINNTVPKLSYFYTNSGQRVPIYSNEHARTVTGFVGDVNNPIGFYIHDPLSGKANEYWSRERLEKHMSIFGAVSNQALVIE